MVDVGTQINQYKVIEHIGRGGMADVWSARDESLGRMVAIKTIARNLVSDADPIAMFEQEARTIANLEHPHILPIFGFGERVGKLYIIMRFVTGGSLEDRLRAGGALPYEEAVATGKAVADALTYAHQQSIVHLDLKPPNILLDGQGAPYLADFGLATALDPQGRAQNPGSGTLLYMAPEQITADELDHRADIYSLALVIFHMLTGQLPFRGLQPMSLRQLQTSEPLPDPTEINPSLPASLTDILRQATAVDPEARHAQASDLMKEVADALVTEGTVLPGGAQVSGSQAGLSSAFVDLVSAINPASVQQQEAVAIYNRAHAAWAGGNGRFLLSVTHFMVMSDYYIRANELDLDYDRDGAQMLLRGALEYDYHLDHWWNRVSMEGRSWVTFHAIRSENPQARVRALYRLETLPDADPPRIPKQVAQALSIENDEAAILAALNVLAYRAALMVEDSHRNVKTVYRGQLLTPQDRRAVRNMRQDTWRNITYTQQIDVLIADIALEGRSHAVRRRAARAIGEMRSARAVRALVEARKRGQKGALRALAYVLDEAPTLPKSIELEPRVSAWVVNTWRRLTENPMQIVWSFLAALAGGWLGMGFHIYRTFRSQSFFTPQRLLNTAAGGLFIGVIWALLVVLALTLPRRLQDFWPRWTVTLWSAIAAYFMAQTVWWIYGYMYLNLGDVPGFIFVLSGAVTALGLVLSVYFRLRGWAGALVTAALTYAVLYLGSTNFVRLYLLGEAPLVDFAAINNAITGTSSPALTDFGWIFAYDEPSQIYTVLLPMVILFALGAHFPALLRDLRALRLRRRPPIEMPSTSDAPPPITIENPLKASDPDTTPLDRAQVLGAGFDSAAQPVPGNEDAELDVATSQLPVAEPRTEEFEQDQVGGLDEAADDDPWAKIDQQMEKLSRPEGGLRTEEFDLDKVGAPEDVSNPDLQTQIGPVSTSEEAEVSPPAAFTEEFDLDQVGGPGAADDDSDDDDDPWAKIDEQLNKLDSDD